MRRANSNQTVKASPTLFVGGGGGGRDVTRRTRSEFVRRVAVLPGLNDRERAEIAEHLGLLYPEVYVDSDQWDETLLEPRFAGDEHERISPPVGYEPLDSPSGRYIIEHVVELPFRHFADWPRLNDIEDKSCDAEAEGNRVFGLANLITNVGEVARQIESGVDRLRSLPAGDSWQSLVEYGVPVTDKNLRVEVCVSLSGGQGTGALLGLMGLLGRAVQDDRQKFKINLHVLFPGFFRAQSEAEEWERRMRALSVLRDLAALKVGGAPLEIPHPDGKIRLAGGQTTELFNHLFVYQPAPAEKSRYESFICRVSESVVDAELSAAAPALRRARSNALELARRRYSRKKFAVVGA